MPYLEGNLSAVERLYAEAFGTSLRDEPVPRGLREYYAERLQDRR